MSLLDPDDARDYLRDWQGRIDRMAASTQVMSRRLQQLRVTAEDSNGLVRVTIDSTGALTDIEFGDRIQRVAPDVVARAVMSAVRDARRAAADRSSQIVTETMGAESVAARTIAEQVELQLRGNDDD